MQYKKIKINILFLHILVLILFNYNVLAHDASNFDFGSYGDNVKEAYDDLKYPEIYNLPSKFNQETFHPTSNSVFGTTSNRVPIFSVDMSGKEDKYCMAITFDCSYINTRTYSLLDVLDNYNFKSTFFMTGEYMEKNPEQVLEILKRGHEIGNHTATHANLNKSIDEKIMKEVMKAHNYMEYEYGIDMCLFRFPYGSYSDKTVSFVQSLGYYPIQWSFDSVDWLNLGKEDLIRRMKHSGNLKPGAIILFHNGAKYTSEALPEILDMIVENGLKCVKVSELIYKDSFYIDEGIQYNGSYKE